MLATMSDHDLPASSVPVKVDPYSLRRVVGHSDLEMPEHRRWRSVVIEDSLAPQSRVRTDRLRFCGCELVLPKYQARLAIAASVHQASAVVGYEADQ